MSDPDLLTRTLDSAVVLATGNPDARARPGQSDLIVAIDEAMTTPGGQTVGAAPTGLGKALSLDTPIPTPAGWTLMGDLQVGDMVFDETGAPVPVEVVHPVLRDRDCYRVSFDDGTDLVADAEHLWGVTLDGRSWVRRTTAELAADRTARWAVPVAGALQLPDTPVRADLRDVGMRLAVQRAGHLPPALLRSGPDQRLAFLEGLAHHARADGPHVTMSAPPAAAETVAALARTCGFHATVSPGRSQAVIEVVCDRETKAIVAVTPVASRPVRCIGVGSPSHLFLAGAGLTPTHNSVSYLVPAALAAATRGERTVVSTESLALQSQIIDKDAPVVVEAVRLATGVTVDVQVLKGWSNWLCLAQVVSSSHLLLSAIASPGRSVRSGAGADPTREPTDAERESLQALLVAHAAEPGTVRIDGLEVEVSSASMLLWWALDAHRSEGGGDRHSYTGPLTDALWSLVSLTPAECPGADSCPLSAACKATGARRRAAEADVVVTNHSMLAVQAARRVPVVIGSKTLGPFDNIVVDEAHELPSKVRDQGARMVSGRRLSSAAKAVASLVEQDAHVRTLVDAGVLLGEQVDEALEAFCSGLATVGGIVKVPEGADPLGGAGEMIDSWCRMAEDMVASGTARGSERQVRRGRRLVGTLQSLRSDADDVAVHEVGVARWVEQDPGTGKLVARATPVDVASMLRAGVWTAPRVDLDDDGDGDGGGEMLTGANEAPLENDDDQDVEVDDVSTRVALSVVAVSATLPRGFEVAAGLRGPTVDYPSPFTEAYARSLLYVPRATPEVLARITRAGTGQRRALDVGLHEVWAAEQIAELVRAGGGRALILAAKASSGRAYAAALRAAGLGFDVYSQWDGPPLRTLVERWKSEETSVMVGTRSLMTGVDAPGPTCSMVVIDRVPRSPGNPVDDARVEDLMARLECSRHTAARLVYATDATLLLEQAAGRLIRSTSDDGVVAVLDPRLLRGTPVSYPEDTRTLYLSAFARLGERTADLGAVRARWKVPAVT